ncbi:hypothetical protein ACPA0F_18655 [Solibacillus silvestris]
MIKGYDEWKLKEYEEKEKVAFICDQCNEEAYVGEDAIETTDGYKIHADCFDEYARTVLIMYCGPAEVDEYES